MRSKEQISHIMSAFDFKKVHSTMSFLELKWTFEDNTKRIPTVLELRSIGEYCLEKVSKSEKENDTFFAGGFEAKKLGNSIGLYFNLEAVHPLLPLIKKEISNELAGKKK